MTKKRKRQRKKRQEQGREVVIFSYSTLYAEKQKKPRHDTAGFERMRHGIVGPY